jgi:hypothetical protein
VWQKSTKRKENTMTTYAEHLALIAKAAETMYLAEDAVKHATRGTDEWVEARILAGNARHDYDVAYAAKMGGYSSTIRKH